MRFARFGVGGFKGCFDVGIVVGVRFMSPSVAVKLTPVRLMLPCGWLGVGCCSDWLAGLLSDVSGLLSEVVVCMFVV
ncbi:hypothetical protein BSPWISOXPB_739 [uncultured Gammaproteobacteria bacterium]|nr:hypothetical protein BSPWISOXPB_739 [uncultured Gammaproteobacteria bacterium]